VPEKWEPVFREKRCDNKNLQRLARARFRTSREHPDPADLAFGGLREYSGLYRPTGGFVTVIASHLAGSVPGA
jgi:hypothetical protein